MMNVSSGSVFSPIRPVTLRKRKKNKFDCTFIIYFILYYLVLLQYTVSTLKITVAVMSKAKLGRLYIVLVELHSRDLHVQ